MPGFDTAPQSPPRLLGEVLEVESVHGALQPNVKLGNQPLCDSDDGNIGKLQSLEDGRDVLLITTNPVKRLRIDDIEFSSSTIDKKLLNSRPQERSA